MRWQIRRYHHGHERGHILYEQGPKFDTNVPALVKLFKSISDVPGVKHVVQSHGTIAPIVRNPEVIEELSPYAVNLSTHVHPASTHPENRYASLFIGLETGSPRLFNQYMKGKAYPYQAPVGRRYSQGH